MTDTTGTNTNTARRLRVTLVKSTIGRPADQERALRSMGLRKLHQTVELQDNPSMRGMLNKIQHLVRVESAE